MDLIVRANWEQMEEGRNMCEALRELFADELEKSREIAMEQGLEQGFDLLNRLNQLLAEQNRIGDIVKAANDAEYQKSLFEEFGLQCRQNG